MADDNSATEEHPKPLVKEMAKEMAQERAKHAARVPQQESGPAAAKPPLAKEVGGPKGPEPTRYGDWEKNGIVSDF